MRVFFSAVFGLCLVALLAGVGVAQAQQIGWGGIFSNDGIGDAKDRWRSGAAALSLVRGPSELPRRFGALVELRLRAEVIAPWDLQRGGRHDRRYAGLLGLGLHSHFQHRGLEMSLGADLMMTGPQTGIGRFHDRLHEALHVPRPGRGVLGRQIGNALHPTLVFEAGQGLALGETAQLRPFVEAQAGLETMIRAGADLTFGGAPRVGPMLRDATTGQRYGLSSTRQKAGFGVTFGGDVARVFHSALLPDGGSPALSPQRGRLRTGITWAGEGGSSLFYGLTWLSKEFETQPKGQVLGSLSLAWVF